MRDAISVGFLLYCRAIGRQAFYSVGPPDPALVYFFVLRNAELYVAVLWQQHDTPRRLLAEPAAVFYEAGVS